MSSRSEASAIDVSFDFRSDTPGYPAADPDAKSPTLRRYHRMLWSKRLPSGAPFDLSEDTPGVYLHHASSLGEFRLASDSVIPSFRKEPSLAEVFRESPRDLAEFVRLGYTIGGMMVFPGNRISGRMTINGARGCHPRIKDRFDLTVECIRRHYFGEQSPLQQTLNRYADFFALFGDFRGFVEHFLLQDIVSSDGEAVTFFMPFSGFAESPVPTDAVAYEGYRLRAMAFIAARNRRIENAHG